MKTLLFVTSDCVSKLDGYILDNDWSHVIMFPEVNAGLPYTPKELIANCHQLVGKSIATTSEHIVLWFLKEVREGRIAPSDLLIRVVNLNKIEDMVVTPDGDFAGLWPDGFFDDRMKLLF